MPSPFPGMDPFVEDPAHWHDIHVMLIAELARFLNRTLPEGFAAHIETRVYIESPIPSAPDVAVLERTGTVATAPRHVPLVLSTIELPRIEIVTTRGNRRVVTAVEVLSPVNKTGRGREQYRQKQREALQSRTNLLEIDLLRGGEHTVAVPLEVLEAPPNWDYIVSLHRAGSPNVEFWDISLRDPLPTLTIPLTDGFDDLTFDLQTAFERIYDDGPFAREVDYDMEPTPHLKGPDARWSDQVLRSCGRRSAG